MRRILGIFAIFIALSGCDNSSTQRLAGVPGLDEYNKGLEFQRQEKIDQAEHEYKVALQKNPDMAEALNNIGIIYLDKGWLDGAEKNFNTAKEIYERTQKTLVEGADYKQSLSLVYCNLAEINRQRAINAWNSDPDGENAAIGLQHRTFKNNAIAFLKKAVELDPMNSTAQAALEKFSKR